jgi:hypothetical protein
VALLAEYALTPDVFDLTSYSSDEVCGLHLQSIKDVLLHEALVRNLRDGEWATLFSGNYRSWHRRGKELLKKLVQQKRLIPHRAMSQSSPASDSGWCDEAIDSHEATPLSGIIVTDSIASAYESQPLVAPIRRLATTPWWTSRSSSVRLGRRLADYRASLNLVLHHANSIMFIDPHLDPSRPQYRDFLQLVQAAGGRTPVPLVEVHRVCYRGSGPSRVILNSSDVEATFRSHLSGPVAAAGLEVEVFIWDDFHDRYLISDLVGIALPNGFDTTAAPNAVTTWTRLGRHDRDDIQREFDPASHRHHLRVRFRVP